MMSAHTPDQRQLGAGWLIATAAAVPVLWAILARTSGGDSGRIFLEREKLEQLRKQLAKVELLIKQLMQQIESRRVEEAKLVEQLEQARAEGERLLRNLEGAAEGYADLLHTISSMSQ